MMRNALEICQEYRDAKTAGDFNLMHDLDEECRTTHGRGCDVIIEGMRALLAPVEPGVER
jgi:hypothetical protein